MSLGKLLATGRSLAGGPSAGRYNVSERNRLPKFNAAKNPFAPATDKPAVEPVPAPKPEPEPALPAEPSISEMSAVAPAASGPSPFVVADLKKTQRIPELAVPRRVDRVKQVVVGLWRRSWQKALALLAWLKAGLAGLLNRVRRVRRKEPTSVIPRFGKPAVQGELSLDNVRVVRNDLEESDLEIVTAETNTSAQVAPTAAPATPNRGPVPPALKKITNRVLGVKLS